MHKNHSGFRTAVEGKCILLLLFNTLGCLILCPLQGDLTLVSTINFNWTKAQGYIRLWMELVTFTSEVFQGRFVLCYQKWKCISRPSDYKRVNNCFFKAKSFSWKKQNWTVVLHKIAEIYTFKNRFCFCYQCTENLPRHLLFSLGYFFVK